jgi:hypothetical protein
MPRTTWSPHLSSPRSWHAAMHWSGKRFAGSRWFRPQPAGNPQQNFRRLPATSRPNALTRAFRHDRHSLSRQTPRNSRSHREGRVAPRLVPATHGKELICPSTARPPGARQRLLQIPRPTRSLALTGSRSQVPSIVYSSRMIENRPNLAQTVGRRRKRKMLFNNAF